MTTSTQRTAGPRAAAWALVVLAALLLVLASAAGRADAARVGPLTSATLLGQSTGHGAITSTFTSTTATSLAGTTTNCNNPWTVTGGTMQVSGTVVSLTSALVTATVPLCSSSGPHAEAGGEIRTGGGSGSAALGVLVHAAATGRPATAAVYDTASGQVQLRRISSTGTWTTPAQRAIATGNGVRHLRLWYVDGVYTVMVNNVVQLTWSVPDATTRAAVEANRAVGIVSFSDTKTVFDNFQGYPR